MKMVLRCCLPVLWILTGACGVGDKPSKKLEERWRRFAEASFEGILLHDTKVVMDVNPQFAELFGYLRCGACNIHVGARINQPGNRLLYPRSRASP